jgi:hypothetical protein
MATKEPYRKVNLVDETRGMTSTPQDGGFNIATVINAPTGTTDRVKLSSFQDLVDTYLVNNSIVASDNTTIQHIGYMLLKSPVYVIRADSSNIRVGIGSYGNKMYFDSEYNFLNEYTIVDFEESPTKTINQIYIGIQYSSTVKYLFYAGTKPDASVYSGATYTRIPSAETTSGSTTVVSIDEFFKGINKILGSNAVIYYTDKNSIRLQGTIATDSDGNYIYSESTLFTFKVNNLNGSSSSTQLHQYSVNNTVGSTTGFTTVDDFITIGTNSYYILASASSIDADNPVAMSSIYYTSSATPVPSNTLFLYTVNTIMNDTSIPSPLMVDISTELSVNITGVEDPTDLDISSGFLPYIIKSNTSTNAATITALPGCGTLASQWIALRTSSDYRVFYNGTIPSIDTSYGLSDTSKYIQLVTENCIPQYFVEKLYEYIKINSSLSTFPSWLSIDSSAVIKYNSTPSIFYVESTDPTITFTSTESDYDIITVTEGPSTSYSEIYHSTDANNSDSVTYTDTDSPLYIKIDDNVFYAGAKVPVLSNSSSCTFIRLGSSGLSMSKFLSNFYDQVVTYFTCGVTENGLLLSGEHTISYSTDVKTSSTYEVVNQSTLRDTWAAVARFSCSEDLFSFTYTKTDSYSSQTTDAVYDVTFNYNTKSYDYTFSFNDSVTDGYGTNLYYERLNVGDNKDPNFYIVKLSGDQEFTEYTSKSFGGEIEVIEPTLANYMAAYEKFTTYDDVYYDIIWDSGLNLSSLSKTIATTYAKNLNTFYPVSIPYTLKKKADFITYCKSLSFDTPRAIKVGNGWSEAAFGSFVSKFCGSTAYIYKCIDNYNSISGEFDAIFGPNNGKVSCPNLITRLSKDDREDLLDYKLNMIFEGKSGQQINFNLTSQDTESYLSEDQNIRIANAISHIADEYLETLIAKDNTSVLRSRVVNELTSRIKDRIVSNKNKCIEKFRVICNDNNNTTDIIEARKIIVDIEVIYLRSIAYAIAYNRVKKLGSF